MGLETSKNMTRFGIGAGAFFSGLAAAAFTAATTTGSAAGALAVIGVGLPLALAIACFGIAAVGVSWTRGYNRSNSSEGLEI